MTVHQFLRVTLAQFEMQVYHSHLKHGDYYPFRMLLHTIEPEMENLMKGATENFLQLVMAIETYGVFQHEGQQFVTTCCPAELLSPYAVRYVNLRQIVTQLAAGPHPAWVNANTLPGAIFNAANVLQNGNQIMPDNYTVNDLEIDVMALRQALDSLKGKFNQCLGNCTYSGVGKPSALVCVERNTHAHISHVKYRI